MPRPPRIFQVKVTLDDIAPPIWRRLLVPANVTLRRMHGILQKSMGWSGIHCHRFKQDGREFSRPDPEGPLYFEDDSRYRLDYVLIQPGDTVAYEYDFGDSWVHTLLLEEIVASNTSPTVVRCIGGARACPPEDCGGIHGYLEFLEAILDPFHERHREMRERIGGPFDSEAFDRDAINRALAARQRLRRATAGDDALLLE